MAKGKWIFHGIQKQSQEQKLLWSALCCRILTTVSKWFPSSVPLGYLYNCLHPCKRWTSRDALRCIEMQHFWAIGSWQVVAPHKWKKNANRTRPVKPTYTSQHLSKNEQKEQTVITYPSYLTIVDAHMARCLAGMSWISTLSSSLCRISSTSDHNQTPIQTQASHQNNTWIGRARWRILAFGNLPKSYVKFLHVSDIPKCCMTHPSLGMLVGL